MNLLEAAMLNFIPTKMEEHRVKTIMTWGFFRFETLNGG